jgi:hypothetical protein
MVFWRNLAKQLGANMLSERVRRGRQLDPIGNFVAFGTAPAELSILGRRPKLLLGHYVEDLIIRDRFPIIHHPLESGIIGYFGFDKLLELVEGQGQDRASHNDGGIDPQGRSKVLSIRWPIELAHQIAPNRAAEGHGP